MHWKPVILKPQYCEFSYNINNLFTFYETDNWERLVELKEDMPTNPIHQPPSEQECRHMMYHSSKQRGPRNCDCSALWPHCLPQTLWGGFTLSVYPGVLVPSAWTWDCTRVGGKGPGRACVSCNRHSTQHPYRHRAKMCLSPQNSHMS